VSEKYGNGCLYLTAALIGGAAWGIHERLTIFAPLVVLVWRRAAGPAAKSRLPAFGVMLAYYSASSRGIINGAPVFFGPQTPQHYGVALWLASATALALPWGIFSQVQAQGLASSSIFSRSLSLAPRIFLASFASAVPPLAVVGWTNPLLAAGLLPSGGGWWSLLLLLALLVLLCLQDERYPVVLLSSLCVCALFAFSAFVPPPMPDGWRGFDTSFGRLASGSSPSFEDWKRYSALRPLFRQIADEPGFLRVAVLPETIAARWSSLNEAMWLPSVEEIRANGKILAIGAEIQEGDYYDNAMLFFLPDGTRLDAKQRIPVPVSMYRPWENRGARAHWFDDGILNMDGEKILVLICYEQFLTWPFFLSMFLNDADVVVATANDWWCRETNLPQIQLQTVRLLCRLFGKSLVTATNF
jgi:hypothetical protein